MVWKEPVRLVVRVEVKSWGVILGSKIGEHDHEGQKKEKEDIPLFDFQSTIKTLHQKD